MFSVAGRRSLSNSLQFFRFPPAGIDTPFQRRSNGLPHVNRRSFIGSAALLAAPRRSHAGVTGQPYNPVEFRRMGVTAAWEKYGNLLTWGRGQCLAILDDGCDLTAPEWTAPLPWGR